MPPRPESTSGASTAGPRGSGRATTSAKRPSTQATAVTGLDTSGPRNEFPTGRCAGQAALLAMAWVKNSPAASKAANPRSRSRNGSAVAAIPLTAAANQSRQMGRSAQSLHAKAKPKPGSSSRHFWVNATASPMHSPATAARRAGRQSETRTRQASVTSSAAGTSGRNSWPFDNTMPEPRNSTAASSAAGRPSPSRKANSRTTQTWRSVRKTAASRSRTMKLKARPTVSSGCIKAASGAARRCSNGMWCSKKSRNGTRPSPISQVICACCHSSGSKARRPNCSGSGIAASSRARRSSQATRFGTRRGGRIAYSWCGATLVSTLDRYSAQPKR